MFSEPQDAAIFRDVFTPVSELLANDFGVTGIAVVFFVMFQVVAVIHFRYLALLAAASTAA